MKSKLYNNSQLRWYIHCSSIQAEFTTFRFKVIYFWEFSVFSGNTYVYFLCLNAYLCMLKIWAITFSRAIQHAISSAWAASSIITKSNEVLSSLRENAPVKVVNTTSAFLITSVTANCCLLRSSLERVRSSFWISRLEFLSLAFNNFPLNV